MLHNGCTPRIEVNPETFEVMVDGTHAYIKPAERFSLGQLYWFG
jgi:urease subunit alpha